MVAEVINFYATMAGRIGSYSERYQMMEKDYFKQLKENVAAVIKDDVLKNKKNSAETNKRRREIMNKKLQQDAEEEARRQTILAERHQRFKDVTQRYQRLSTRDESTRLQHQDGSWGRHRRAVSAQHILPPWSEMDLASGASSGSNSKTPTRAKHAFLCETRSGSDAGPRQLRYFQSTEGRGSRTGLKGVMATGHAPGQDDRVYPNNRQTEFYMKTFDRHDTLNGVRDAEPVKGSVGPDSTVTSTAYHTNDLLHLRNTLSADQGTGYSNRSHELRQSAELSDHQSLDTSDIAMHYCLQSRDDASQVPMSNTNKVQAAVEHPEGSRPLRLHQGILKKPSLDQSSARSRTVSAPTIRDSLLLAKSHYKLENSSPIAKLNTDRKSVRFVEGASGANPKHSDSRKSLIPVAKTTHIAQSLQSSTSKAHFRTTSRSDCMRDQRPVIARHSLLAANLATDTTKAPSVTDDKQSNLELNSVPLNRTPTDQEINALWVQVRSCLNHSTDHQYRDHNSSNSRHKAETVIRSYTVKASQDSGFNSGAPLHVKSGHNQKMFRIAPRPSSSNRHERIHETSGGGDVEAERECMILPNRSVLTFMAWLQRAEVKRVYLLPTRNTERLSYDFLNFTLSESLLSFLAAEALSQRENDDGDVATNNTSAKLPLKRHPTPRTALSAEEQQLLLSLDKLNQRLDVIRKRSAL